VRPGILRVISVSFFGQASHVLRSPMRRKIYEAIVTRPGISIRDLARRVGTTWPNAKYHVIRLETAKLVETRTVGRLRVTFASGEAYEGLVEARAMLAEPTARRIAIYVVEHPGESLAQIMKGTGGSQRVIYYHLKRLIDAGLVEHSNAARYRGIEPTPLLLRALV